MSQPPSLYFDPNPTVVDTENPECRVIFNLKKRLPPLAFVYANNTLLNLLHNLIIVREYKGAPEGLYVEWVTPKNISMQTYKDLIQGLCPRSSQQFFQTHNGRKELASCSLSVRRDMGVPFGKLMAYLALDTRRGQSLLIAFLGTRNKHPCECCLNRIASNVGIPTNANSDRHRVHLMSPYFDCRSIPGYLDGACANCIYHVEGIKCTYSKDSGLPTVEENRAVSKSKNPFLFLENEEDLPPSIEAYWQVGNVLDVNAWKNHFQAQEK